MGDHTESCVRNLASSLYDRADVDSTSLILIHSFMSVHPPVCTILPIFGTLYSYKKSFNMPVNDNGQYFLL